MSKERRPYRYFLKEEKESCIKCYLEEHLTMAEVARRYDISKGLLSAWLSQYREHKGPWGANENRDAVMDRLPCTRYQLNASQRKPKQKWKNCVIFWKNDAIFSLFERR